MNTLHFDAILHICRYLSNADHIKFSMASRFYDRIKFGVTFDAEMYILDIIKLPYFNRFSNVVVNNTDHSMPTCARHLTFSFRFNQKIDDYLPATVTHITFGYCFNQLIDNCIPKSITYLKFGRMFNQNLNTLHSSVEHIYLHKSYEQCIDERIQPKITYY